MAINKHENFMHRYSAFEVVFCVQFVQCKTHQADLELNVQRKRQEFRPKHTWLKRLKFVISASLRHSSEMLDKIILPTSHFGDR